jgi:hypothetical protein
MVLGSTRPLTEMGTSKLPRGKGRPTRKADLTVICESRLSRTVVCLQPGIREGTLERTRKHLKGYVKLKNIYY